MKKVLLGFVCAIIMCANFFAADVATAKKYEAQKAYVNAITEYCEAGIADPWNKSISDSIKKLASKLASGDWGNNFGVNAGDANKIFNAWKDMELSYKRYLSAAIHYKLVYTAKAVGEKQNDYETMAGTVRFRPDFKFEKDFPAYKEMQGAFKKLQRSDFAMAKQVKDLEKNVRLQAIGWKAIPKEHIVMRDANGNDIGTEQPIKKYNIGAAQDTSMPTEDGGNLDDYSTKENAKGLLQGLGSLGKQAKKAIGFHMPPNELQYNQKLVKGCYWYELEPTVRIAVADANGKRISNWTYWEYKKGVDIYVPLSKAGNADHYILSDTWCMVAPDGLVSKNYIDFNYKPQSSQIVKK